MSKQMQSMAPLTEQALTKVTQEIEAVLKASSVDIVKEMPAIQQAIVLANGVQAMRAALTDQVMAQIFMPLAGTKLGFRTDRDRSDKGPYPIETVRECLIEAMMRGFRPVGNEWNLIADNFYGTKEGFERKVRELEGLTDLRLSPGVPHMANGGALVPYRAFWNFEGKPMTVVRDIVKRVVKQPDGSTTEATTDERIAVRVNAGQGADAILGKAKRKLLAQIYDTLTGTTFSDEDVNAIDTVGEDVPEVPTKPANQSAVDDLIAKHSKKNGNVQPDAPQGDPAADSSGHPEPGSNG